MRPLVCVLLLSVACKSKPVEPSLIGNERGLDHVGIAVRDLAAARSTFHSKLGFGAEVEGKLPNGIQNINYYFEDATYLETMNAWDPEKARWLADFTAAREGAVFSVLSTSSLQQTSTYLAAHGVKTGVPLDGSIKTGTGEGHWQTMFFDPSPLPGNPLFFIAYPQPKRANDLEKMDAARKNGQIYKHPNTALGIRAVWLAVPDLAPAVAAFTKAGFVSAGAISEPRLGAVGERIIAGKGSIIVVAPSQPDGAVAEFLSQRGGSATLGVSIEVASMEAGKRFAERATKDPLTLAKGVLGESVLIPPAFAHGAWLEFFSTSSGAIPK